MTVVQEDVQQPQATPEPATEVRIIHRDVGVVDSTLSDEDAESTEVHFIPSPEMVVQQMAAQTQVS